MKGRARAASYLGQDLDWVPPAPTLPVAKPDLRALVETVEDGGKVIWLSDGFPIDRPSYGRITLTHSSRRE